MLPPAFVAENSWGPPQQNRITGPVMPFGIGREKESWPVSVIELGEKKMK